ncbi:MAG: alpha/beta hydrolase [Myxococcaceae bacterium]
MGCNFVRLKERFIERSIRRSGLVFKKTELGADRVSYWEGGTGPVLVLLHGFGADATWGWSEQIPVLSKHFHLIVPDLLWFGESKSQDSDFSVEHQATAIRNLMKHLGVEQFDVAGISYGGIVALMLIADDPKQIRRAVIVSSPGPVYTQKDYDALLERFHVESASEIVIPKTLPALERLLNIAYRDPPYVPKFAKPDIIDYLKDGPGGERAELLKHLVKDLEGLKSKLAHTPDEVLIIWGSDDQMFPLEIAERLKAYLGSKAELKVLKGARHAPNLENAAEFNQVMLEFLQQ